jgi:hypothetical protein
MSELSSNENQELKKLESKEPENQELKNSESKEPEKMILRIRSPSEIAYLNAKSHASSLASDLDQLIEPDTYLTPSMLSHDEHSDLEKTSPKLKFGETKIHEYISISPSSNQSLSPNENFNTIKKEINPSTPRMK